MRKQKYFSVNVDQIFEALEQTDIFKSDLIEECVKVVNVANALHDSEGKVDYNTFLTDVDKQLKVDKLGGKYSIILKSKRQLKNILKPLKEEYEKS